VSNEQATQTDVYFDDVKMTYTPTSVVQSNEYYPYGLQTGNSWTRDNTTNNFLYNEGSEMNNTSGLYDLPYRNYDAVLGRFHQVDPLSHMDASTSPFAYAGNNPIVFNDPSGLLFGLTGVHQSGDPNSYWSEDDPRGSGGGSFYGGERGNGRASGDPDYRMQLEAQDVRMGRMSIEAYAAKYGAGYNGEVSVSTTNGERSWGWAATFVDGKPLGVSIRKWDYRNLQAGEALLASTNAMAGMDLTQSDPGKNTPGGKWDFWGKGSVPYQGKAMGGTNFIGPGPTADPYTLGMKPVDAIDEAAQRHDFAYWQAGADGIPGAVF